MAKPSVKGVLIGGVLDIVATNILMIPFIVFVMIRFDLLRGAPPSSLATTISNHGALFAVALAIGSFCSALGGYVAAAIAKRDELLNGVLSSYLCLAIGAYSVIAGSASKLHWAQALSFVASPLCGLAGGYVRRIRKITQQAQTPAV